MSHYSFILTLFFVTDIGATTAAPATTAGPIKTHEPVTGKCTISNAEAISAANRGLCLHYIARCTAVQSLDR